MCGEVGQVMAIVRVVAACPVNQDIVLTLGMLTHVLQLWKRLTTHTAVLREDVVAGITPVLRLQVPHQSVHVNLAS